MMDHKAIQEVQQNLNNEIRQWLFDEFCKIKKKYPLVESFAWRQYTNLNDRNRLYIDLKQDYLKINGKTLDEWYQIENAKHPNIDAYNEGTDFKHLYDATEAFTIFYGDIEHSILKTLFGINCWVYLDKSGFQQKDNF